ncbi:hypothetical protein B0T11DRAFT_280938 [Plectosphaerella cucumerina]|uniref:DUF3955 domain-containing protein n=1 Tax=Plectosphaerella cucumerina TaxID=40658 RepID=A0A8K0TGZ1_9PEZI|nr:hypothetical protein B0T11DRAFT_280938 [Plectosphaerella cucumerina]
MTVNEPLLSPSEASASGDGYSTRRRSASHGDADEDLAAMTALRRTKSNVSTFSAWRSKVGLGGVGRRTLGILCLLVTVFLWTLSNFMASYIFSDSTYDKPFFMVYFNTSVFVINLIPSLVRFLMRHGVSGLLSEVSQMWHEHRHGSQQRKSATAAGEDDEESATISERLLVDDEEAATEGFESAPGSATKRPASLSEAQLNFRETAVLSLEFCMLWFLANYFASACLQFTSVGSVTILTSMSSVWTLIFCAGMGLESFTVRKLAGVLASLAGVVLISTVDLSGHSDKDRGSFPHKSTSEMALGDFMAFLSALLYGLYVTVMKRRVGNEDRVDMQLFFGLVGVFNIMFLWPLFFVLHWSGLETFELPPTGQVWLIIIANSLSSFVSDISWAYAMLLTTPLVVTVGLSLTIPLSLIGEMIQYSQYSSWVYWMGAGVVFLSFVFVNNESHDDEEARTARPEGALASAT